MGAESQAPLRLYRGLLRLSRLLPKDARAYYQEYARENFVAFSDEPGGGERAVELLARGREHGLWVAKKVIHAAQSDSCKTLSRLQNSLEIGLSPTQTVSSSMAVSTHSGWPRRWFIVPKRTLGGEEGGSQCSDALSLRVQIFLMLD